MQPSPLTAAAQPITSSEDLSYHEFDRVVLDDRAGTSSNVPQARLGSAMPIKPSRLTTDAVPVAAINDELQLDPWLQAQGDWRGPLAAPRGSPAFEVASRIIDSAIALMHATAAERADTDDSTWLVDGAAMSLLLGREPLHAECHRCDGQDTEERDAKHEADLLELCGACTAVLQQQPTLVRVPAPAKVFGDVHGQLRDLLLLWREFGSPSHRGGDVETTSYVFNGGAPRTSRPERRPRRAEPRSQKPAPLT